ncbi:MULTISPECIES: helix-turn-helix domain-containing protein [Salinigranum]|jgi:hypothetical protein|uniref:DUF7437 domain-containing protein n=1 Tax=Salinigranum TaxID=1644057 RepID=UPI0010A8E328|nr:helix-turn-helix domain-containing protein [Salinigranum halophilum]
MPTLTDHGGTPPTEETSPRSLDDLNGLLAATTLLQTPRLAREYVYLCYYGPTTIQELINELEVARATAYDDVERLERLGVVDRDESTRPYQLTATPFAFVDGRDVSITPTLIHAVALTEFDDDAAYFHNRHGVSKLTAAVQTAGKYYAGELTQRMAATEMGVQPAEGMAIIYALRPVLKAGREHDPYFEQLISCDPDALVFDGE